MKLDLCCGPRKPEGYYGIDIIPFKCVDKVHNLDYGIPLPDSSCDVVRAHDAIEHVKDGLMILGEIWRVLKDKGLVDILVPSTDGRGAFQDQTHVSFWNQNSFMYWLDPQPWADYYRRERLFIPVELRTTPMSEDNVCHVVFKARAMKSVEWLSTFKRRFKEALQ